MLNNAKQHNENRVVSHNFQIVTINSNVDKCLKCESENSFLQNIIIIHDTPPKDNK